MLAQQPDAAQIAQERRQAELDAPKLVEVLELKPGMTVADVGFRKLWRDDGGARALDRPRAASSPPTLPSMRCGKRAST